MLWSVATMNVNVTCIQHGWNVDEQEGAPKATFSGQPWACCTGGRGAFTQTIRPYLYLVPHRKMHIGPQQGQTGRYVCIQRAQLGPGGVGMLTVRRREAVGNVGRVGTSVFVLF